MSETRTTCPYCGVGCGVILTHDGAQITGVRGDPAHPANFGRLCTKGATLHLTASATLRETQRLQQPLWRAQRGAAPSAIGWDAALDLAAQRFAGAIGQHGPDAVGFYLSGQMLTEDYYVFNKLAKGLIGSNNVDTNSRLCMSSAVVGYKRTLGADAPPCCYEDLAEADTVFITGSNAAWAHPVLFRRLEDARRARPGQRWIVVDTRRTETAAGADLFLQIRPGSDVALCHGMLAVMLAEELVDAPYIAAHTQGFEALRDRVGAWTPAEAARVCGIAESDLVQAARWFAQADRRDAAGRPGATLSLYCQGLNQSHAGSDKNAALINLHLACGQIGRPGAGPFSLTGQPNAMGGREVGALANQLSAHRDLADPAQRAEVAALWGVEAVPERPGLSALEMFEAAADGALQALWIVCTNPAQSLPDQAMVRRALQRCPFVVLQEAFAGTATAVYADLLLPASSWGEKIGSVTNSERRISRVRAALPPPGLARHDWVIGVDFARRLEARLSPLRGPRRRDGGTLFPYPLDGDGSRGAQQIWEEHRESTRGRDLDITGLSWERLDREGPQQWPFPTGAEQGRRRLYEDGRFATADGRARFAAVTWWPVAEPTDPAHPYALTTGRLRDQWHGGSRTGLLGRLFGDAPEPALEMHAQDLAREGLREGDLVRVRSRRGSLVLPVQASTAQAPGQVAIAMHWGSEWLGGCDDQGRPLAGVNGLTHPARCPLSRQPELKHAAVALEPAQLPWRVLLQVWRPQAEVLRLREALRPLMDECAFAVCVPFGREPHDQGLAGLLLRAADRAPQDPAQQAQRLRWLDRLEALLELPAQATARYDDAARSTRRRVHLVPGEPQGSQGAKGTHRLRSLLLAGDTAAEAWLRPLLQAEQAVALSPLQWLAADARAPLPTPARGAQVCACLDVDERQIRDHLARDCGPAAGRLPRLQAALRCGTQCGSCLPRLQVLLREPLAAAA